MSLRKVVPSITNQLLKKPSQASDTIEQLFNPEIIKDGGEFSFAILERFPDSIIVFNPDTSIKYANHAFQELTRFSSNELLNRLPPFPLLPAEKVQKYWTTFHKGMVEKRNKFDILFQKRNGEPFRVELSSLMLEETKTRFHLSNWVDITESK